MIRFPKQFDTFSKFILLRIYNTDEGVFNLFIDNQYYKKNADLQRLIPAYIFLK